MNERTGEMVPIAELAASFTGQPMVDLLLRECRRRWVDGDKTAIVRFTESFLVTYRQCRCEAHTCGSCRATLWIAGQLEAKWPEGLTDAQIEKAQEAARILHDADQNHYEARMAKCRENSEKYHEIEHAE